MVQCLHCSAENSGGAFCTNCGKSLPAASMESPANPTILTQPEAPLPASVQPSSKRSPTPLIVGGVALAGLLGAIALLVSSGPTVLEQAYEECVGDDLFTFGISIDDDGRGMFLDMEGDEDILGASYSDILCVLEAVDTPSSVLSQMDNTNSLMGIQNASWDGLTASWSYHPDRGLDISLRMD